MNDVKDVPLDFQNDVRGIGDILDVIAGGLLV